VDANTRRRVPGATASTAPNAKAKSTVCPNPACRKPLPRCAICLLNLGSPISSTWAAGEALGIADIKGKALGAATQLQQQQHLQQRQQQHWQSAVATVSQWFAWCQTCRHGGHVEHMDEWFREHAACPVADCTCRCRELD